MFIYTMLYIKFSYNLFEFLAVALLFLTTLVIFQATMSEVTFRFLQNVISYSYFI